MVSFPPGELQRLSLTSSRIAAFFNCHCCQSTSCKPCFTSCKRFLEGQQIVRVEFLAGDSKPSRQHQLPLFCVSFSTRGRSRKVADRHALRLKSDRMRGCRPPPGLLGQAGERMVDLVSAFCASRVLLLQVDGKEGEWTCNPLVSQIASTSSPADSPRISSWTSCFDERAPRPPTRHSIHPSGLKCVMVSISLLSKEKHLAKAYPFLSVSMRHNRQRCRRGPLNSTRAS